MFQVRKAVPADADKIFLLYKKVASLPEGIARNIKEINTAYIKNFMQNSAERGIEFVVDNPADKNEIIAEIHCYGWGIEKFGHVFTELTIAVSPDFQGQGIGKLIFTQLLDNIENEQPHIFRVELVAQESNKKAIQFYQKLGFVIEGRFENRIKTGINKYEADVPMAWFNKNFRQV